MKSLELKNSLLNSEYDKTIADLYEDKTLLKYQRKRYIDAIDSFVELYGDNEVDIYSAAGRSEVGGNHTDHQHGCVLAASINLDAIAVVSKRKDIIKVVSDDFDIREISINNLEKKDDEEGTSESLIRGVVSKLKEMDIKLVGSTPM